MRKSVEDIVKGDLIIGRVSCAIVMDIYDITPRTRRVFLFYVRGTQQFDLQKYSMYNVIE